MLSLGALLVAIVVAVTVTIAVSDNDSDPASWLPHLVETSQQDTPTVTEWTVRGNESDNTGVIRALAAGTDRLVVVTRKTATGIDRRTGEKKWVTTAPGTAQRTGIFCGASTTTATSGRYLGLSLGLLPEGNSRALLGECDTATVLDLDTGKLGARTVVAQQDGALGPVTGMPVEFIDDTTMVVGWETSVLGLSLDGQRKWKNVLSSRPEGQRPNCRVTDLRLTGRRTFIVMSSCIERNGTITRWLDEGDAKGTPIKNKLIGEAEVGAPFSSIRILSASPVVLKAFLEDKPPIREQYSLLLLDESWNVKNRISDERTNARTDYGLATVGIGYSVLPSGPYTEECRSAVRQDVLIAPTAPNKGRPNRLVATDLATGKQLWSVEQPGLLFMQVLAVTDRHVIALEAPVESRNDWKQSIAIVDAATGKVQSKKTTEVKPRNNKDFGVAVVFIGFVYADDRAYGIDFQAGGEGSSDSQWLAYTVG